MSLGNGNGTARTLAESLYIRAISNLINIVTGPILIGLVAFLVGLRTDVTALQGDIKRIDDAMIQRTALRYTSEDAKRDRATIDLHFDEIERRMNQLEERR